MPGLEYSVAQNSPRNPVPWSPQDDEALKQQAMQLALAIGPGAIKGQSLDGIMRMMEMSRGMLNDTAGLSPAWQGDPFAGWQPSQAAQQAISPQALWKALKMAGQFFTE
jgi:hypothetical protein